MLFLNVLKSTFSCVWSPAVRLCDLMMGHFSTSMPINEFGMGLIPPMDIQTGSLTADHCDEWPSKTMRYSPAILFPLPPPFSPLPLSHCPRLNIFFFCVWWIGLQPFSASTPLATGVVQCCRSRICAETQIREGTQISRQWALEACNTKPVMEVAPQTAIDVPWDCVSLSKQTNANMLISASRPWHMKMIEPRSEVLITRTQMFWNVKGFVSVWLYPSIQTVL